MVGLTGDLEPKKLAAAKLIEGKIVEDKRMEICIKGTVLGFPATLEAFKTTWPFGVNYYLETQVIVDPSRPVRANALHLTVSPRQGRGLMRAVARVLLLESRGMTVHDPKFESRFIVSHNNGGEAERFVKYPGVLDRFVRLDDYTHFSEVQVRIDAGVIVSQPTSFRDLDLDVYKETFKMMADLGQVVFESFPC